MTAPALAGGSARRERLEAEVREQLEPLLGPAGRPVGRAGPRPATSR